MYDRLPRRCVRVAHQILREGSNYAMNVQVETQKNEIDSWRRRGKGFKMCPLSRSIGLKSKVNQGEGGGSMFILKILSSIKFLSFILPFSIEF